MRLLGEVRSPRCRQRLLPERCVTAVPDAGDTRWFISALGAAQICSWGTLFYGFPLIAEAMRTDLGWSKTELYGAATCGMLLAGLAAYPVGAAIDRGHGRYLMAGASVVAGLLLAAWSQVTGIVAFYAVLAVLVLVDLASLPRRADFEITRQSGRVASLAKRYPIRLLLANRSRRSFSIDLRDGADPALKPEPAEFSGLAMPPRSRLELDYALRPARRGAFEIGEFHVRARGRLGLFQRFLTYRQPTRLNVYPDMQQLAQYALLARTNRLSQLGVRRARRIGQDHDFERLRDYTVDDNYRHIEWRATARRRRLTVKDFQATRSQRVIFLIDCGRMMTGTTGGISFLWAMPSSFLAQIAVGSLASLVPIGRRNQPAA